MCNMEASSRPRVGFWWGDKKSRELSTEDFTQACSSHGLELVKLDFSRPLEEQGPLSAIVHKFCDILVRADHGDAECQRITADFERFCKAHPEVLVLDPLENVRKVLNRYRQYKLVEQSKLGSTDLFEESRESYTNAICADWVFIPPFVELTSADPQENLERLRSHAIQFPIVCKPLVSHGMKKAHQMCLVFGPGGLGEVPVPCVAQQFVAHDARLLKVYVLGPHYYLTWRPSLRNFTAGDQPSICFNSQDISKPHSSSPLNAPLPPNAAEEAQPCPQKLRFLVDVVRQELGQLLFGMDVIVEKGTGRLCIIDVNNFPGYDGVANFLDKLSALLAELVSSEPPDSGIDTSDSSDERKPQMCRTPKKLHLRPPHP